MRVGDVLAIDASGVEDFDFSFAAELFGKTVATLGAEYPGRFLIVEGLTDCTRENLNQALEGSNLLMIERRGDKLALLGKVHPADEATFEGILEAGEAVSAGALKPEARCEPHGHERTAVETQHLGDSEARKEFIGQRSGAVRVQGDELKKLEATFINFTFDASSD